MPGELSVLALGAERLNQVGGVLQTGSRSPSGNCVNHMRLTHVVHAGVMACLLRAAFSALRTASRDTPYCAPRTRRLLDSLSSSNVGHEDGAIWWRETLVVEEGISGTG